MTAEQEETTATVSFTATVTGTVSTPVVADLAYDKNFYASAVVTGNAGGPYVVTATTLPHLGVGKHTSSITFRLCQEAGCANVYSGSTKSYAYALTVKAWEWTTFQGDAAHTGYVHATLNSAKFAKAWQWTNPDNNFLSAVIPANDSAYISAAPGKVYSFSEATGAQNWTYDLSSPTKVTVPGAPAYNNGVVYVPAFYETTGSVFTGAGTVRGLDASTGTFKSDSSFTSQVSEFNSPTFQSGQMYFAAGYYGGVVYKYAIPSGSQSWVSTAIQSNEFGNESPAVDQTHAYYSTEHGVAIFNKSDGALAGNVSDPVMYTGGATDLMSPIIASSGHVIVVDPMTGYQLVAVNPASQSVAWRSAINYQRQPVVAGSTVYGVRLGAVCAIDAISDANGSVLWTWNAPANDSQLIENPIVTDNLLFVSSTTKVYAINLATHQTVWTYAAHGRLSLSSGLMLYVVANDYGIGGNVTAIRLAN